MTKWPEKLQEIIDDFIEALDQMERYELLFEYAEEIDELDGFTSYNLPDHLLGIIWRGKYKGQKQKWFIFKFTGQKTDINVHTKNPEFSEWKWMRHTKLIQKHYQTIDYSSSMSIPMILKK